MMFRYSLIIFLYFFSALGVANNATAQAPLKDLTEMEWIVWPDFCKAAFVGSGWASGTQFNNRLNRSERASAGSNHGIPGTHHFCVGMVFVDRTKHMTNSSRRKDLLERALAEIDYSYSKMNKSSATLFSLVAAYRGMAFYRQGKREKAFQAWDEGIQIQPTERESYIAKAEAFLAERKPSEALAVLLKYDESKLFPTADGEYFLGHTYFELGRYEEARRHADRAYALGYPFPGLKNRLERVGH